MSRTRREGTCRSCAAGCGGSPHPDRPLCCQGMDRGLGCSGRFRSVIGWLAWASGCIGQAEALDSRPQPDTLGKRAYRQGLVKLELRKEEEEWGENICPEVQESSMPNRDLPPLFLPPCSGRQTSALFPVNFPQAWTVKEGDVLNRRCEKSHCIFPVLH